MHVITELIDDHAHKLATKEQHKRHETPRGPREK